MTKYVVLVDYLSLSSAWLVCIFMPRIRENFRPNPVKLDTRPKTEYIPSLEVPDHDNPFHNQTRF